MPLAYYTWNGKVKDCPPLYDLYDDHEVPVEISGRIEHDGDEHIFACDIESLIPDDEPKIPWFDLIPEWRVFMRALGLFLIEKYRERPREWDSDVQVDLYKESI